MLCSCVSMLTLVVHAWGDLIIRLHNSILSFESYLKRFGSAVSNLNAKPKHCFGQSQSTDHTLKEDSSLLM